jgi:hypothetical protein
MKKKKVWIIVFLWRGLLDELRISYSKRGAEVIFKRRTGKRWQDFISDEDDLREECAYSDWGGSEIFEAKV